MSLAESTTSAVSPESPWLGLRPFTEDVHEYFFGRSTEVNDLFQRVVHKPLTLLFGRSGLGKSSLLQAALVPRLRDAGFLPILLRLNYADESPPLVVQFADALTAALAPTLPGLDEALSRLRNDPALSWLLFHDPTVGLTAPDAPRPVVLLDQFEEIFTMGQAGPERQAAAVQFLEMLADLVENRVPETLRSRLETDDALADRLDYATRPAKIVISLREDFLHLLERYRGRMPALMDNRFELQPLTGPQALEAVIKPGRLRCRPGTDLAPLVSEATGSAIVRFVTGVAPDIPLAEIDAVPPLLSLLCAELNEQRLAAGESIIRPGQLEGRAEDILGQFYERCFSSQPSTVRTFVENRLLSATGFRESTTLDTATHELIRAGLTHDDALEAIAGLVDARLLTSEERGGIRRIELTHDILTSIARRSREERVEKEQADRRAEAERKAKEAAEASAREAADRAAVLDAALKKETEARRDADLATRRARWLSVAAILVALIAIAACVIAAVQWKLAKKANEKQDAMLRQASEQDYYAALRLIKESDSNLALSYLARSIQYDPKNELARMALWQVLLLNQNFPFKLAAAPLRHEKEVRSASFSPDGKFVVTASSDGTARVWETATGKAVGEPLRHGKEVWSAAFSPDARFVVTASKDGTARVWEAATGKAIGEPLRHGKEVLSAAFSPDGKFVVTASSDGTARVWETATGKAVGEPLRHGKEVWSAAFSPDGKFVVTASWDGTARVWEAATGKAIGAPLRHEKEVWSAAFSPDGKFVVTASWDGTARVWEAATGKAIGEPLRHEKLRRAAFSPDGKFVVTASLDGTARVWETATGKAIGAPLRHEKEVWSAAFSPDARFVVTASLDWTARVWEAATGKAIGEPLRHEKEVLSAAFSPDARFVVTASKDGTARVWEAATGKAIGEPLRHGKEVLSAAFSPDARFVVTASSDGTARVWEATTGKAIGEPLRHESGSWVRSAAFSPDARFVVTASSDGTARVWEAATGKAIGEPLRHENDVVSAAFSPDARFVVTASVDGTARVWEAATGKAIGEPLRHENQVVTAAFSPDGRFVVTASLDWTARIWETATGKAIGEPLRHEHQVLSAAFSPDGRFVVTASVDGTARIWEAATGKAIGEPLRHERQVLSAAFSPDGKFVVTASLDWTARVWEAATGKAIGEPLRHENQIWSAAFSPDGKFVVTASLDGTARVWEAATGKAIGEPLRHENQVLSAAFSPDGRFVVTASSDGTARVWPWFKPLGDSPEKLIANIEQITFRKIAQDGGPAWIFPETPLSRSKLSESFSWVAEPTRTRHIWPGAVQTVPEFIMREIQDARRFREDQQRAKSILDNAYPIDPAHPLIHLALAMVEHDKQTAAFLRDYDLKRLPESCGYTKDLNPKHVLELAAKMCAEQGDEERAQIARDKLRALEGRP